MAPRPRKPPSFAASAACCADRGRYSRNDAALLGRRLLRDDPVDVAQLVEDLLARRGALRPEAGERVVALARPRGDVLGDRVDELAVVARLGGVEDRPERRHRLLERLDRAARVGE
jgi:hypothetical protein